MIQKLLLGYLNDMDDIYKNIDECNLNKEQKILIIFDDMVADMFSNKKLNPIVTELFLRGRKLNISLVFITQSYFAVLKNIRLNQHTILLWKFQTKENLNVLHLIINQRLTFKTFWTFIKSLP